MGTRTFIYRHQATDGPNSAENIYMNIVHGDMWMDLTVSSIAVRTALVQATNPERLRATRSHARREVGLRKT